MKDENIDNIPPEDFLLEEICNGISYKHSSSKLSKEKYLSDRKIFFCFLNQDTHKDRNKFIKILNSQGISYATYKKIPYAGASKNLALNLIRAYSLTRDISIKQTIANYIEYCFFQNYKPQFFITSSELVNKIYSSYKIEKSLIPDNSDLLVAESSGGKFRKIKRLEEMRFKVAFSFPGEMRKQVSDIVTYVKRELSSDTVFYDRDFTAQLAKPNLDTLLQEIYLNNSELIVVFLSGDYERKMWCGIEWRAIRHIIKNKDDSSIMFIRTDESEVPGIFSLDGYVDLNTFTSEEVADFIIERVIINEMDKEMQS